MRTEEIKRNFARNIRTLREKKGLTQLQFGNAIGYSDKAVSKWENGDVLPDVSVLDMIAEYYSISIDELIGKATSQNILKKYRHSLIVAAAFFIVLTISSIVFFFLSIFEVKKAWLSYVYLFPVYFLVAIILSTKFYNYKQVLIYLSLLTASLVVAVYLTFLKAHIVLIFTIGACLEIVYLFLFFIIRQLKKEKKMK